MKSRKRTEAYEKPIVQTVKLDTALFVRLKTFSAKTRRTHQDILHEALLEYLKRTKS
jgi:predicted transcriptional regulator